MKLSSFGQQSARKQRSVCVILALTVAAAVGCADVGTDGEDTEYELATHESALSGPTIVGGVTRTVTLGNGDKKSDEKKADEKKADSKKADEKKTDSEKADEKKADGNRPTGPRVTNVTRDDGLEEEEAADDEEEADKEEESEEEEASEEEESDEDKDSDDKPHGSWGGRGRRGWGGPRIVSVDRK